MSPAVHGVPPALSVASALACMRHHRVRHLLVLQEEELLGLLSETDYRKILEAPGPASAGRDTGELCVGDIMTPRAQLITVEPEIPLEELAIALTVKDLGALPVVDRARRVVGIITPRDVIAALLRDDRQPGPGRPRTSAAAWATEGNEP